MTIDFIEDNQIDFQEEKAIQKPSIEDIDFQVEQPNPTTNTDPLFKVGISENIVKTPYQMVMDDNKLTREQKVLKIKEIGETERKNIDKEYRKTLAKLYTGAALEIGSAAIPVGGVARLGGKLAFKLAKPAFSEIGKKVLAKNIGSGVASGMVGGAVFGVGDGLMENEDLKGIAKSSLIGAGIGGITGGAIGGLGGIISTKVGRTKEIISKIKNRNKNTQPEKLSVAEDSMRELIQSRRANIDTAKFEAMEKINKFTSQIDDIANELNLDSKNIREVLPFIRENTELPIQNFNRPDLIKVYNSLNKDQKEVLKFIAQNHFDEMETYWNNLAKVKGLKSSMSPDEYITHIWDMGDNEKAVLKSYYNNLKTKSQFEKLRKIPTYKEGIENGLDIPMKNGENYHINLYPKTLDYAEIQKIHSHQLIDAAENSRFLKGLKELQKSNPKYAKELEEMATPILNANNEVDASKNLAGKLLQKAGNAYDTVNNFAKGCKFLFNGMHVVALTESAAAHEGILPFKTIKTLGNLPKIIDGIKNNNYEVFKNSPAVKQAMQDGVQFGAISDINIGEFNTFIDGVSNLVDRVTLGTGKIITKPMKTYIDVNNKFLWNYLHNTYKLHAYQNLINRVSKNGKVILSDNVRKDIGQLVNDTFGGQNWDNLGIKPESLKTARRLLLSPDWNMSATVRQSLAIFSSESGQKFLNEFAKSSKFGMATRELSRKLGLSSFTNDIQGAGIRGQQARKYFMTFLIQTAIYSNLINACNRAVDSIANPEKYEGGINYSSYSNNRFNENDGIGKKTVDTLFPRPYVGNDINGREMYARVGKQALEVPEIIEDMPNSAIRKAASKTAPLINPLVTKVSDDLTNNWNRASIKDRYKDTFTPFTVSGSKNGFHPINIFYSTSKGLNAFKAREYLKECIKKGDIEAIEKFKPKMKANKIDFNRAIKRVYKELEQEDYGNRRN